MKNPHAVALGKRNKGKKKTVSKTEAARRRDRLALARQKRWAAPSGVNATVKPKIARQSTVRGEI